jgi:hypothetical protein
MQRSHGGEGIGGLREDPRYRREAHEQHGHERQQAGDQPDDFDDRARNRSAGENERLGRQMSAETMSPAAILTGRPQLHVAGKVPPTTP